MDVSYHNHSNWSDGLDSVKAMYDAAKAAGLKEFGLSDHYVVPGLPNLNDKEWSMPIQQVRQYVDEVTSYCKSMTCDYFTPRIGLEVDYFRENWKDVAAILDTLPLDYRIGSCHYAFDFSIDHMAEDWEPLSQEQINAIYVEYWRKMMEMAQTGVFDIVGHLDLPKKFAFPCSCDLSDIQEATLQAIKAADMAIELNTAGWFKPCNEPYPSLDLLKRARQLDIPVIISADAHETANVNRAFDRAQALLAQAGYGTQRWRYEGRKRLPLNN